jgi:transposase
MRHELADSEWAANRPPRPNKRRDQPEDFGPYVTRDNPFTRWRQPGVWSRLMSALADRGYDAGRIRVLAAERDDRRSPGSTSLRSLSPPSPASGRVACTHLFVTAAPRHRPAQPSNDGHSDTDQRVASENLAPMLLTAVTDCVTCVPNPALVKGRWPGDPRPAGRVRFPRVATRHHGSRAASGKAPVRHYDRTACPGSFVLWSDRAR